MSKLSKWLPFKFKRKKRKQGEAESDAVPVSVQTRQPATAARATSEAMFEEEVERFFGDFTPRSFQPKVDIVDEGDHIRVSAELPGLDRDDIEVRVEKGRLQLRGEKTSKHDAVEDGCYRVERYFGSFQRVVPLPVDVDTDGVEAKFDKGLLTMRFPKTREARSARRIPIT